MEALFPSIPTENEVIVPDIPQAPVFESVEYKIQQILDKIRNIDTLDEQDIKNIIVRQYHMILNYDLFLANERKYALELFTNYRFLTILKDIIGTLELSKDEIICLNKLTYDYYVLKDKDKTISDLLLDLSYFVNNKTAIRLSATLGIRGGQVLAMVANSAFDVQKKVNRVNRFIVKADIALSIQDIINIYCVIYDRFMYPIIYTMLEVEPLSLTDIEQSRFRAISSAILILLNAMTSEDIKKVISNYVYILQMSNVQDTRFSLKEACRKNGLDRISYIIHQVELDVDDCPVCL